MRWGGMVGWNVHARVHASTHTHAMYSNLKLAVAHCCSAQLIRNCSTTASLGTCTTRRPALAGPSRARPSACGGGAARDGVPRRRDLVDGRLVPEEALVGAAGHYQRVGHVAGLRHKVPRRRRRRRVVKIMNHRDTAVGRLADSSPYTKAAALKTTVCCGLKWVIFLLTAEHSTDSIRLVFAGVGLGQHGLQQPIAGHYKREKRPNSVADDV